jgi:hypothetical protein
MSTEEFGVEVNVSEATVEPVWYLPGTAERLPRRRVGWNGDGRFAVAVVGLVGRAQSTHGDGQSPID